MTPEVIGSWPRLLLLTGARIVTTDVNGNILVIFAVHCSLVPGQIIGCAESLHSFGTSFVVALVGFVMPMAMLPGYRSAPRGYRTERSSLFFCVGLRHT